jgi:hypothetical protein
MPNLVTPLAFYISLPNTNAFTIMTSDVVGERLIRITGCYPKKMHHGVKQREGTIDVITRTRADRDSARNAPHSRAVGERS